MGRPSPGLLHSHNWVADAATSSGRNGSFVDASVAPILQDYYLSVFFTILVWSEEESSTTVDTMNSMETNDSDTPEHDAIAPRHAACHPHP